MPNAGIAPYNVIAIVNLSTTMSDGEGVTIVAALNMLLPTFCNDWSIPPITTVYVGKNKIITNPLRCLILDKADVENALGYHSEYDNIPYAKVFVKTILENNGVMLYSTNLTLPTVAQTISHEVFEMIVDLHANVWWSDLSGTTLYAAEVSDPVQGNIVPVKTIGGTMVGMSDWILPAWSNPQAKIGPFNHLDTIKKPFTLDKGGYAITLTNGKYTNVFGSEVSAYTKAHMSTRAINRLNTGLTKP